MAAADGGSPAKHYPVSRRHEANIWDSLRARRPRVGKHVPYASLTTPTSPTPPARKKTAVEALVELPLLVYFRVGIQKDIAPLETPLAVLFPFLKGILEFWEKVVQKFS